MAENSIDSIVTDPPYGLSFMGKKWDYQVPSIEIWRECLRVLKPGGHLLSFAGTRTHHRMAVNIEDAGFEIRDMIAWIYGSGFPKSLDVSKAIDKNNGKYKIDLTEFGNYIKYCRELKGYSRKELDDIMGTCTAVSWWEGRRRGVNLPGKDTYIKLKKVLGLDDRFDKLIDWAEAERETIGQKTTNKTVYQAIGKANISGEIDITEAATDGAKKWEGWGTALKPAMEPITVARKPIFGTIAANVLEHGTGALNIDGCRVNTGEDTRREKSGWQDNGYCGGKYDSEKYDAFESREQQGRWPANVIHDGSDEVTDIFPHSDGQQGAVTGEEPSAITNNVYGQFEGWPASTPRGDSGSAARFFYCAKASKDDRDNGLEEFEKHSAGECTGGRKERSEGLNSPRAGAGRTSGSRNHHPTVKPVDLMCYLCRLVTPPKGTVLDPFMGSGSTGKAAMIEGFMFIGIDRDPEYMAIAEKRIKSAFGNPDPELFYKK